jgi:two-component system cell cycle sensor histidine kinase/response regulator CckA
MAKAGEKTISSYSYLNPDESFGLKISEKENTTTAKIVGKISQGKKDSISISHVIKTEYKNVIQEVFFTKLPIINGSLLVQFPKDYHFHFCPSTASEFKLIEVLPSNGKVTQIYNFEGAVLPNQGFAFSLNRKNKEELKLECLKIISQNFTHKLRNVFGSVISISDALIQSENLDEHSKSMIVDILNSGKRAIEVMKDLESFEEDKKNRFERMNLRVYIQELLMQNDTKNWIKNHIIVKYNYEFNDDILDILSNDELLKNLFITLFEYIYSKKIDNNSSIVLYLDNIYIDSPLKCYNEVKIGEYVALSIVGNGVKINRQDLNECFEPFSTTTKTNNSTGLEMAKILNTMQLHSGYCDLMSEEKTIQFKLFFPVYRHGVITKVPSVPLHTLMGNRECILVVDDEEKERIRVLNILNSLDYRPSVIDSGVDAIELLKQNRNKFDLVILDMVMPDGLNGSDTYEKITEINPNQKAIIVSGYPEKDIINEIEKARKLGAGKYIRKPYTLQDLGEAIKYELMEPHV